MLIFTASNTFYLHLDSCNSIILLRLPIVNIENQFIKLLLGFILMQIRQNLSKFNMYLFRKLLIIFEITNFLKLSKERFF